MTFTDVLQWGVIAALAVASITNSRSIRELIRHTRWKARR